MWGRRLSPCECSSVYHPRGESFKRSSLCESVQSWIGIAARDAPNRRIMSIMACLFYPPSVTQFLLFQQYGIQTGIKRATDKRKHMPLKPPHTDWPSAIPERMENMNSSDEELHACGNDSEPETGAVPTRETQSAQLARQRGQMVARCLGRSAGSMGQRGAGWHTKSGSDIHPATHLSNPASRCSAQARGCKRLQLHMEKMSAGQRCEKLALLRVFSKSSI